MCLRVRVCVRARVWVGVGEDEGSGVRACACARVAPLLQHATRRHIGICGLSGSATFLDIISQMVRFSEKLSEYKMCVLIFSTAFI